jgi:glycerophosphoryl diester phosphodiesterase
MNTPVLPPRRVGVATLVTCLLALALGPATARAARPSAGSAASCASSDTASLNASALSVPPCAPRTCPRTRVSLLAHRGTGPGTRSIDGRPYSEDTVPAFVEAMQDGADGFETDYWPTSDGRLVSHHDRTLDRMTNGTGPIADRSWAYLRRLRNTSGATVPTLRSVEDRMVTYGGLRQQEIKDGTLFSTQALRSLIRIDRAHLGRLGKATITASELSTLHRVHALAPGIRIGLIDRSSTGRPRLSEVPGWVDVLAIDVHAADAQYVKKARKAGHAVSVRKVNTVLQLHEAWAMGIRRIITDRPEVLGRSC